jgi:colicin import membrane protein
MQTASSIHLTFMMSYGKDVKNEEEDIPLAGFANAWRIAQSVFQEQSQVLGQGGQSSSQASSKPVQDTQQRRASLQAEQTEQQEAAQRVAALRAWVSSGGSEDGAAATGSGSGLPGGGRGTGTSGSGGIGTGGLSGIRLRDYQALVQKKVYDAWSVPLQSKGLQAVVFLTIDRAGHVEQFRFVQRSGNVLFDESLQRAIKQAEPLPPLPEGRSLDAELRFRARD